MEKTIKTRHMRFVLSEEDDGIKKSRGREFSVLGAMEEQVRKLNSLKI